MIKNMNNSNMIGDLNGDGNIMMTDLIMCLYHTSGRKTLTGNAFLAADIDGNGAVKMNDLMKNTASCEREGLNLLRLSENSGASLDKSFSSGYDSQ